MKKQIVICMLLVFFQSFGQEKFKVKVIGFSMNAPKGWCEMKNEEVLESVEKPNLTDEEFEQYIRRDKPTLVTYTKYDPKDYARIIPTIKLITMKTPHNTIKSLIESVEGLTESAKKTLKNFRFSEEPIALKVSGKDAAKFAVQFTMNKDGNEYEVESHSYHVLMDGYEVLFNLLEEVGSEEDSKLFDEIFQSIKITK